MGYEYLKIKRDPRLVPWGSRPLTPEMRNKLSADLRQSERIYAHSLPVGDSKIVTIMEQHRNRQKLASEPTYVNSRPQLLNGRVKDIFWVSNMASVLAIAGIITVATVSAPAVLSFGLVLGTLLAGAGLVEKRFSKRSVRNRK